MKQETKQVIIAVLIVATVISLIYLGIWYVIKDEKALWENERELCFELDECDKYSCLAEYSFRRSEKRNYLLQEQNCLLRLNLNQER